MQPRPIILSLLLALLFLLIHTRPAHAQTGVEFRIVNNGGVYEVYMRPTFTPTDKNTLTAQITIKVPHGTGAARFQPQPEPSAANYVGDIAGPTWTIGSRTDGPTEDGTADYISWVLDIGADASVYNWTAGQEVLAFRLTNAGNCLGALALMEDGDAFNMLPNSANTNPGNEIALNEINFGVTNAYIGTYGGAANCNSPGGVGANLALWLKADAGVTESGTVSQWDDQSGNGLHANNANTSEQPTFVGGDGSLALNFNPMLDLDGGDKLTLVSLTGLPTGSSARSLFGVGANNLNDAGWGVMFSYGTNSSLRGEGIGRMSTNALSPHFFGDVISSMNQFDIGKPGLIGAFNDGASNLTLRVNGEDDGTGTATLNTGTTVGHIGAWVSNTTVWDGTIGEIIVYSQNLSATDIQKVESYLALKYGITLEQATPTDYLASDGTTKAWNATANAGYSNDIAGIGRDDDSGLSQKQSKSENGDALVAMGLGTIAADNASNSNGFSADTTFLVWGNNDGAATWTATGAPSGYDVLSRQWRVQESGTVGGVKMQFDVADADFDVPALQSGTDYYLIYDSDNDDGLSDETPVALTNSSGDIWETTATIDFADGMEFTLSSLSNNPPTITPGQSFTVADSAPSGTTAGTVAASDAEGDPLTFSISGGNPGGDAFAIDSSSGLITVNNSSSLPALGTAVPLTINVDDGKGSDSQTVTITIASPLVQLKVLLQGAYDATSGLMRDDLRAANLLPDQEPYTAMPSYSHLLSGGGETVANPTTVFADNGLNSIVDWVFVELRDAAAPGTVVATRAGLLQRDGDVVEVNGSSPLLFSQMPTGSYYVGVRHCNHLGAMTKTAIALSQSGVSIDFTDTSVDFWESDSLFEAREQNNISGNYALWAGDADANQKVVFAGQNNDIDAIFNAVDQAPLNYFRLPTYILSGYHPTDINLDGKVIFAGQNNDLDVIFNIVTGHPGNLFRLLTYTIPQQMAQ